MKEGLVLRRISYEETSFILTILSKDAFESVIVKGAKKKNSMKLGISEPLTNIEYVTSKNIKMPTLIEGVVLNNYSGIKNDLYKFYIASVILEYAVSIKESDIDTNKLYNLVSLSLDRIDKSIDDVEIYLFRFEAILLGLLGVSLDYEHILENYNESEELIDSLINIMNKESDYDSYKLRLFFKNYYERELGITLKSKKLYFDLFER